MNASKETWIRTVVLAVALLNQILTAAGMNPLPFSEEGMYQFLSTVVTAGVSLWNWWKNNSFTAYAVKADEYLTALREGCVCDD